MNTKYSTAAGKILKRLISCQTTQSYVAEKTDIWESNLSRKMKGERPFRLDEFIDICKTINADPSRVIEMVMSEAENGTRRSSVSGGN